MKKKNHNARKRGGGNSYQNISHANKKVAPKMTYVVKDILKMQKNSLTNNFYTIPT